MISVYWQCVSNAELVSEGVQLKARFASVPLCEWDTLATIVVCTMYLRLTEAWDHSQYLTSKILNVVLNLVEPLQELPAAFPAKRVTKPCDAAAEVHRIRAGIQPGTSETSVDAITANRSTIVRSQDAHRGRMLESAQLLASSVANDLLCIHQHACLPCPSAAIFDVVLNEQKYHKALHSTKTPKILDWWRLRRPELLNTCPLLEDRFPQAPVVVRGVTIGSHNRRLPIGSVWNIPIPLSPAASFAAAASQM